MDEQLLPLAVAYRFIPVVMAGSGYVAEIGFRFADGGWRGLALSLTATTPPDAPADFSAEVAVVRSPAVLVVSDAPRIGPTEEPRWVGAPEPLPAPPQAVRLTALVWEPVVHREAPSSAGVVEWQAREVVAELPAEVELARAAGPVPPSAALAAGLGLPASEVLAAPAPAGPSSFWFKVNAELILYGSTEPDARVTIAGRPVALRPDGSFSFRFALPDGDFTLPAIAVNAAETDGRTAQLNFTRATEFTGEVGLHPQDASLRPPVAAAIA